MDREEMVRELTSARFLIDRVLADIGFKKGDRCDCGHLYLVHGAVKEGRAAGYHPCLEELCGCVDFSQLDARANEWRRKVALADLEERRRQERRAAREQEAQAEADAA